MLLTGCAKKQDTIIEIKGKRFSVSAEWNKQNVNCDIDWSTDDIIFEIKQPEQLNGMQFKINKSKCTINYLGMEYVCDNQQLLGSFVMLISDALQKSDGVMVQNSTLNNKSNGYEWTIFVDQKGNPKELIIDELDASIKFNKK